MWKRRRDKGDESSIHQETGGLVDTHCGAILRHLVATRSWAVVISTVVLASIFLKAAIGLGGYSGNLFSFTHCSLNPLIAGHDAPPMYGDFEAQRHWMELTLHVPLKEWYYHDLQWWGLDYPPLTAYISLLFAKLYSLWVILLTVSADVINPEWLELYNSRGLETPSLKAFMRFTVIISDYVLYVPALLAYTHYAIVPGRKIDKVISRIFLTDCTGNCIHAYCSTARPHSRRSRAFPVRLLIFKLIKIQFRYVRIVYNIAYTFVPQRSSTFACLHCIRSITVFQTDGIILRPSDFHLPSICFTSASHTSKYSAPRVTWYYCHYDIHNRISSLCRSGWGSQLAGCKRLHITDESQIMAAKSMGSHHPSTNILPRLSIWQRIMGR